MITEPRESLSLLRRIVDKRDEGGWAIRDRVGGPVLDAFQTKREALERAEVMLRAGGGGELLALNTNSRQYERRVVVPPSDAASIAQASTVRDPSTFIDTIDREGDRINELLGWAFPIASMFGTSVISPMVAEADNWIAAFLATLAWSLGWAFTAYVAKEKSLRGAQAQLYGIAGCFVASIFIANFLGVGTMEGGWPRSTSPAVLAEWLMDVVRVAFVTYGWFGALAGAGIGGWLGHRVHEHFNRHGAG